jgi:hypothetical protein
MERCLLMQSPSPNTGVLVIGAGPTGLAPALALSARFRSCFEFADNACELGYLLFNGGYRLIQERLYVGNTCGV